MFSREVKVFPYPQTLLKICFKNILTLHKERGMETASLAQGGMVVIKKKKAELGFVRVTQ